MTKKILQTEENILDFTKVNGVRVPFWEDNKPFDLGDNNIIADIVAMYRFPKEPVPKPKR